MKYLVLLLCLGFVFAQKPTLLETGFHPFDSRPYLTPTAMPTSSININWNTKKLEPSIVAYGLTRQLEDTVRLDGLCNYHHVMLTDLLPGTRYFYKVLPKGSIKDFKTFPIQDDTFSFVAFGDTRSDSVAHQSVIDQMAKHEFDFLVHSGDLVNQGDNTADWQAFFNIEDTILQTRQFLPSLGNHDRPYWPYDTLFALPDAEYFYSVTYGNSHFIILDNYLELYGYQRNWLVNDLIKARTDKEIDWIFAVLHSPPYSSGSHGSNQAVREAWCPIFEEYSVDIVFCGHDHSYERTKPINGVVYIVAAGGGAPLYEVGKNDWTVMSTSTHHFCLVNIAGHRLDLKTIKPDGSVIDSLTLRKD